MPVQIQQQQQQQQQQQNNSTGIRWEIVQS